jgi:hypothetical protein
LFENENDNKRRGRAVVRETREMLTDLVDYVEIDEDNTYAIYYTNGAFFKSASQIGVDGNTCYVLQAILESGIKIVVCENDGNRIVLNDTEDYRELYEAPEETEETEEPVMV